MLKPTRMCRIECVVAQESKDRVMARLHREGVAQVDSLSSEELEESGVGRDSPLGRAAEVSALRGRMRAVVEALAPYGNSETSLLEDVLGAQRIERRRVDDRGFDGLRQEAEGILGSLEGEVSSAVKGLKELGESKGRLAETLGRLEPLKELDVPASYFRGTGCLHSVIGLIAKDGEAALAERLRERFGLEYAVSALSERGGVVVEAVHVPADRGAELDQLLRASGFEETKADGAGTFRELYADAKTRLEGLEKPAADLTARLNAIYREKHADLMVVEELLRLEEEKCTVFARFGSTKEVSYMRLWIPRKRCDAAVKAIEDEASGLCSLTIDREPRDAPSLLENHPLVRPFELLTRMYSTPKYNQIDPTFITAPTFVLFTGFMIADAVYGLTLLVLALYLLKAYGKYSKTVSDFMLIVVWCSLATVFFGVLTGSYLGDFLAKYVLGIKTSQMPLVLMDSLAGSNTITLFVIVLAVGVLQTVFGNVMGVFDKVRQREYKAAVKENVSSLLFIAGLAVAYLGQVNIGLAISGAGFLLFVWNVGLMAIMQVPGILGNILSYVRLLALNLTTPGLAMAFNLLAAMAWGIPVVGPLVAAVVFIMSHALIIFLSSIGPFVHSLRLHFVEFYSTFYGGGGVDFTPFAEARKYTMRR